MWPNNDAEQRRAAANHEALQKISETTGRPLDPYVNAKLGSPESPIGSLLTRSDMLLKGLEETVNLLERRFAPVLAQDTDGPEGGGSVATPNVSALATSVIEFNERLSYAQARIRRICDRCEL